MHLLKSNDTRYQASLWITEVIWDSLLFSYCFGVEDSKVLFFKMHYWITVSSPLSNCITSKGSLQNSGGEIKTFPAKHPLCLWTHTTISCHRCTAVFSLLLCFSVPWTDFRSLGVLCWPQVTPSPWSPITHFKYNRQKHLRGLSNLDRILL